MNDLSSQEGLKARLIDLSEATIPDNSIKSGSVIAKKRIDYVSDTFAGGVRPPHG